MRSQDFERIHIEFCDHYGQSRGDREYYDWLRALSLDESKEYGNARESFRWAKTMLRALREDSGNKYYGVLVGLPIVSMNGNIYHERDLIAAALSLKGKHPSLNHKDEFWFKPGSRYGTLTVEDAKYEDGAVEAVLRVPKDAVCPICDGAPMTSLIDNQHIVNVSLEGSNNGAFEFGDPPFTLLTSNVLPGIPLARIKPLEKILSEAFHSTISTGNKKKMIKAVIKEDKNQNISNDNTTVNTQTLTTDFRGTWGTDQVTADSALHTHTANMNKTVALGESPADKVFAQHEEACPEGTKWNPETGACEPCQECVAKEENAPDRGIDSPKSGPPRTSPPDRGAQIPKAGALPNSDDNTYWAGKAPVEPSVMQGTRPPLESLPSLEERRARVHAELSAKDSEAKAVAWEQKHNEVYEKLSGVTAQYNELNRLYEALKQDAKLERDASNQKLQNTIVRMEQAINNYNAVAGDKLTLEQKFASQQEQLNSVAKKYNESLSTNLELSKKLTAANEDYLGVAKKLENTEEALGRARNEAKRITRIQA